MASNRFRRKDEEEEEKKQQPPESEESAPAKTAAPDPVHSGVRSGARGKVVTQEAWNQTQNIAKTRDALENTDYTVTKRNWDANDELGERRYNARLARHATGLYTEEEKLDYKPNKMRVEFSSIQDNEQAVFVAASLYGKSKQQFLKDYAEHTGQSAETLYRQAESHDGLFSGAMSYQGKMKELGLMSLTGEDIDIDTAGPDTIVQAIRDIADEDKQKEAVKLFQSMTRDKESRFYGYNAYAQDYSFRDSAVLTKSGYKKYAKDLEGVFDPRGDALEKSLRIYVAEYDKLAKQGSYVLKQELPLLEKAFAQQMGLSSAPDVETIRRRLSVEDSIRATRELGVRGKKAEDDRSTLDKLGDWWSGLKGKISGAVADWGKDEEEPEKFVESQGPIYQKPKPEPTPTIDQQIAAGATSRPISMQEPEVQGPTYRKQAETPKTIDQLIADNAAQRPLPKKEAEVQGPAYQKKTIDQQIAERAASTSKDEEQHEVHGPVYQRQEEESKTVDQLIAMSAAMRGVGQPQSEEEPEVQPGSVDLVDDPVEALVGYVLKGRGDELTDETEAEVEAYVRSSPEMMALLGILSDEELEFVRRTEDMPYMAVARKTGMLGPLTPYAQKVHSKGFLKDLTDDASSMLISLVKEASEMPLTREETELVEAGFTNRSTLFFEKYPEKLEALDAAFSLSEELRMEALGQKDVSSQEALNKARKRCRSGYATEADWKLVYDHAPVTTAAEKYGDKAYHETVGKIMQALDESYATDSTDDWFNMQTLAYLHDSGLYQDLTSSEAIHYKSELESYLREALAGEYDTAYALGYENLGAYWASTGTGSMGALQEKALALQTADERAMAGDGADVPIYKGDGSVSTGEAIVEGGKLGLAQKKQVAYEALATLGVATNREAERFEVTTHYYNTGSFTDAEARCKSDLYQMVEQGYFPNEEVAGYVKDYLDAGGSALELGVMPSDYGWAVARNAEEAGQRVEDLQAWAQEKLTAKQGKAFEISASTALNTANQLESLVLSLPLAAVPGASAFGRFLFGTANRMVAYGDQTYNEGMSEALKGGADLTGGHVMGTTMAFAQAVSEMYTDLGIADDVARAMGLKDLIGVGLEQAGGTAARRFWHAAAKAAWRTAEVVGEEATKDEFFGGTFTEAAKAGTWKAIELTNGFTEMPSASELMKIAGAAMEGGLGAIGPTTRELISNLGENVIMTLPIALLSGGAAGAGDWRSTRALRTAMGTGEPEAIKQAGAAIVEDMQDPKKAAVLDAAALEARISKIAADLMVNDPGEIGAKMAAARIAKEQADSHKATLEASTAANQHAVSTIVEMQDKLDAGDVDPQTVVNLNEAQEAFAKSRRNIDESAREYQEKKAQSDSLHGEALTMARNEASRQVQQERAELAQKVQDAQAAVERQREEGNVAAMDAEAFIEERHPDATEEQKEEIRAAFAASSTPQSTEDARNVVNFATRVSDRFGVEVRFVDSLDGANSKYESGVIYITKDAAQSDVIRTVMTHELTHYAESSGDYKQLFEAAMEIARERGSLEADLDSIRKTYAPRYEKEGRTFTETDAEQELVAQVCEQLIGGDEAMIERIVGKKPSLAARIADSIKRFINRMRGVKDPEIDRLHKVERLFRKALDSATVAEGEAQYSISDKNPMTKKDFGLFYSKIGEIKAGKDAQFKRSADGQYILAVNNKLVYTDGNHMKPRINSVVEILLEDETEIDAMREVWYEYEDGNFSEDAAFAIGESVHQKEVFSRYDSGVSGSGERAPRGRAGAEGGGDSSRNRKGKYSLPSGDLLKQEIAAWRSERSSDLEARNKLDEPSSDATAHGDGERQFATKTAQQSQAMPDWLKKEMWSNPEQRFYMKDTNDDQIMRAWAGIRREGYEATRDRLLEKQAFDKDDVAAANIIMAMAFRDGDVETAMNMAHRYNVEGTTQAQALQARKIFSRMTPSGMRTWAAGKSEARMVEYLGTHKAYRDEVKRRSKKITDKIKDKQAGDELLRLLSAGDFTINSSNNKWGTPINEQQKALIDEYKLGRVARPGLFYNRATAKQRMLEAILATPNPLEMTGFGLTLVDRLEMLKDGQAVITNADLDYIGRQMAIYAASDADARQGREGDLALSRAYEAYGNITPATGKEKRRAWRYTSMLLSVPSAGRNVIGNAGQNMLNAVADGIAVELDKKIAKKTGERTRAHLNMKERADGWNAFAEETKNTWRDYFTDKSVTQKGASRFNTNQRGRVYQGAVPETMRLIESYLMSVGDRNFWKKKFMNSMAEQQRVAEENGVAFDYDKAVEIAEADANYATFTEDSAVRDALQRVKDTPVLGAILDFVMPFTGVPTNITKRMWEYSPAGLATAVARDLYRRAKKEDFDQREYVNGISRGITGTAMFGAGILLREAGKLFLGTSEDEDDLYNLNTAQGEQYSPYIQVGGEYVSLAAFAPSVSALIMGATAYDIYKNDGLTLDTLKNATFAGLDQILDASYMSGLQDLMSGFDTGAAAMFDSIVGSVISQNVPAVLGQLATALDPYARDTKDASGIVASVKSGLVSKIPILREEVLPAKVDITGEKVRSKEGLRNFFDPFTTTDVRGDETLDELERLWRETGGDVSIPGFLVPNSGKITILTAVADDLSNMDRAAGEHKLTLNSEQRIKYNEMYGKRVFEAIRGAMDSSAYRYGDDRDKAQILEELKKEELQEIKLDIQRQICSELGFN